MTKQLLGIPEALEVLPVSRSTLYEEIAAGRISTVHIRRRVFIAVDEIQAYIGRLSDETAR